MSAPNILVVVVDGLRASALGAYGNTSFHTPALDRFAAKSFLLDSCYAPAADLDAIYRALWLSLHPARDPLADPAAASLPRLLAAHGYQTALISDDPSLASFIAAADFDEHIEVAANFSPSARVHDASETSLAHLFSAACDSVSSTPVASPRLIWVHASGMYGPWDAPLELQQLMLDEGDPPPLETVDPPDLSLADAGDPDAAFQSSCAYAAQIMVLDACWETLLQAADSSESSSTWLIVLLGARGFPLGEHQQMGGIDPRMYTDQLHVPWLVRFPNNLGRLARSNALASHIDLLPTLIDFLGAATQAPATNLDGMSIHPLIHSSRAPWRDALLSTNAAGHRAIRTVDWCLRQDPPTDSASTPDAELYVRPDDRWEANDVAKLCPDVVETLTLAIDNELNALKSAEPASE